MASGNEDAKTLITCALQNVVGQPLRLHETRKNIDTSANPMLPNNPTKIHPIRDREDRLSGG
jgi:hypothetical protein